MISGSQGFPFKAAGQNAALKTNLTSGTRGPFLKSPGNLTDQKSLFQIKVSRKVWCVLTSNEFHFVSLADNFTVQFSNLLNPHFELKTKQLNAPGNYRELRETGPWMDTFVTGIQSVVSETNLTTGKLIAYLLPSS